MCGFDYRIFFQILDLRHPHVELLIFFCEVKIVCLYLFGVFCVAILFKCFDLRPPQVESHNFLCEAKIVRFLLIYGVVVEFFSDFATCGEGMQDEKQRKKANGFFDTQPKKKLGPGRMAQTPRAGTGDSVGRFRRYR